MIWKKFKKNKLAFFSLLTLILLFFIGIYAPLFASSKPLLVFYDGTLYFPALRYLFYRGYFSKPIDLFFNVLMLLLPCFFISLALVAKFSKKVKGVVVSAFLILQLSLTTFFVFGLVKDPERNLAALELKEKKGNRLPDFDLELSRYNDYQKINMLLNRKLHLRQKLGLSKYEKRYLEATDNPLPIPYEIEITREKEEKESLHELLRNLEEKYQKALLDYPTLLSHYLPHYHDLTVAKISLADATPHEIDEKTKEMELIKEEVESAALPLVDAEKVIKTYQNSKARLHFLERKNAWLAMESERFHIIIPPLFRPFHWEEDAGGGQLSNPYLPWWERTRLNRKDLTSALIFGVRISIIVGLSAVVIALAIGIPLGLFSGYFAGKVDMVALRFIEIWEAMPTFFTLLLISSILNSKSLFLTILVLGFFGWTSFARYIRAEVLRERNLPYVMASKSLGFDHSRIMFSHVLPNAFTPVLALLPFAMMSAITSEAGLSFLGLGEEGSTSWGVLMSEARSVFPGESYLLWPPALLLTILLVSIALVGDGLRDALDPRQA